MSVKESVKTKEDEHLLCSLVESRAIAPAIKAVFDRNWQETYPEILDSNLNKRSNQIRNICNDNYTEFVGAIENLVTVKNDFQNLKQEVKDLNTEVQKSGKHFASAAEEVIKNRTIKRNLNNALHILSNCQYLMSLATKAQRQIDSRKFLSALKTLDQLKRVHLPRFSEYEFSKHLEMQIPEMITRVKETAKADFVAWNSTVRERAKNVGLQAMEEAKEQLSAEHKKNMLLSPLTSFAASSASSTAIHIVREEGKGLGKKLESKQQQVREEDRALYFAPVYQCLHIYETLNVPQEFQQFYCDKRKAQALLGVEFRGSGSGDKFAQYENYFAEVCGFFVIEDAIWKLGNGEWLMSKTELEHLWSMLMTRMQQQLSEIMSEFSEVEPFLKMKQLVSAFCRVIVSCGLIVSYVLEWLVEERKTFEQILFRQLRVNLEEIFASERFVPLTIKDAQTYEQSVLAFDLPQVSRNVEFPVTMPFSAAVPEVMRAMCTFIEGHSLYSQDMPDQSTAISQALEQALIEEVDKKCNMLLDIPDLLVFQVVQLSINAKCLAESCSWLHRHAQPKDSPSEAPQGSTRAFQQTRMRCEDMVFEIMTAQIDNFLAALDISWLTSSHQSAPTHCITDLVAYLESTMMPMVFLEASVREAIHYRMCKHVCNFLLTKLKEAKKFNLLAIYNLNHDVRELEEFALRCGVDGLVEVFSELRQFINLFLSGDAGNEEIFANEHIKNMKYGHVSYKNLYLYMEKFRDVGLMTKLPAGLPKLKKRDVEATMRRILARVT